MKQISTILAVVAIALAASFYVIQSRQIQELKKHGTEGGKKPAGNSVFRIAYFDMDSLEAHYDYFKDAQVQVKSKETAMNMDLSRLDRDNQKKIEAWRQKGNAMTQAEGEQAQQEYAQMQQTFQKRKQELEQELYRNTEDLKTSIRKKIEEFLKDYNKEKNYSYIFAYDPSSFIYNKDTTYNITTDLVDGLNAAYKKK
jgi:outer membrane protein